MALLMGVVIAIILVVLGARPSTPTLDNATPAGGCLGPFIGIAAMIVTIILGLFLVGMSATGGDTQRSTAYVERTTGVDLGPLFKVESIYK